MNEEQVKTEGLTFGLAIEALKLGKCVTRKEWNSKGVFIFRQIPAHIPVRTVVPKMQSLPDGVKEIFKSRLDTIFENVKSTATGGAVTGVDEIIRYEDQVAMVSTKNIITSWSPSISDCFAEDWYIIE